MRLKRKKEMPRNRSRQQPIERQRQTAKPVYSHYNAGPRQMGSTSAENSVNLGAPSRVRLAPTIIAIIVILLSVLFSLTLSTKPSISTLNDQPSPYRTLEEYSEAASQLMGEKLNNRSKLTIQTSEVEKALLELFPELNAAVVRLPVLGRRPNLVIDIRPPAMIVTSGNNNFVLDESGTVISDLKSLSTTHRAGLLSVKDESGLSAEVGTQVLPSDTVNFISAVTAQLKPANLKIASLTLPASANQLDIRLEGVSYYIKTDLSGDIRLQMGGFLAVKQQLEKQGIKPAEYIDVRVEEKVFYK